MSWASTDGQNEARLTHASALLCFISASCAHCVRPCLRCHGCLSVRVGNILSVRVCVVFGLGLGCEIWDRGSSLNRRCRALPAGSNRCRSARRSRGCPMGGLRHRISTGSAFSSTGCRYDPQGPTAALISCLAPSPGVRSQEALPTASGEELQLLQVRFLSAISLRWLLEADEPKALENWPTQPETRAHPWKK